MVIPGKQHLSPGSTMPLDGLPAEERSNLWFENRFYDAPHLHPVKYPVSVEEHKNLIAHFGIVLCYFLFFHLTGQALSPNLRPGKPDGERGSSNFYDSWCPGGAGGLARSMLVSYFPWKVKNGWLSVCYSFALSFNAFLNFSTLGWITTAL